MPPTNQRITGYSFLQAMHRDGFFPDHVVDQGRGILLRLCERIEAERPSDLTALYVLTHAATEEFNELEADIETTAREEIAEDFWFVAQAYGFADADAEELVATRDW
ncbi:DUF5713 family protein [Nonomuraea glycinis]|uniref:DUF5713 family protein n=1 Tax=Nonomuraea glycinis TaxID=2047744 RepID=UPI002E14A801|nr:DUF5713 family protein [Nonomuraea glycinis]